MAVTAPGVVFRFLDEAAFDGVAVEILKLLGELVVGEDVEVVIAELPELRPVAFELFGGLGLEGSEEVLELDLFRFREKEMNVLGHEDVAKEEDSVPMAETFEGLEKDCAGVVAVEVGTTTVTTECDEVLMAEGVVTLQLARHCRSEYRLGAPFMDVVCP
jgi:hypothetical protein